MTPPARSLMIVLAVWTAANLVGSILLWRERAAHPVAGPGHAASHPAELAAGDAHAAGPDDRRVLALPADARDAVLAEMRTMLVSIQGASAAAARGDTGAIRTAVRPSGMAMAADHALEELLPQDWLALALDTHRAFDSLPLRAGAPAGALAALGELTAGCNGCHAMYRLEPAQASPPSH